ncbi:MAG: heavy-metal-associated domain-containing protein [Coriobacteriia bacterium]
MAANVTSRFATTGMHCNSCSMLIQLSVGDLPGVLGVNADAASGLTEVTYDPDQVTADAIVQEIVKAGYGAELAR